MSGKGKGAGHVSGRSRGPRVKLKPGRGRKISSRRWLERHLNDPFVAEAQRLGYRSRAAFKLKEMENTHGFLKKAGSILDLGSAPGGWTQIIRQLAPKNSRVIAVDILDMDALPEVTILKLDFLADDAEDRLLKAIGGKVDVVLSDMAAPTTGHKQTDHLRTLVLVEAAFDFAIRITAPGGTFVAKVLQGGTEAQLLAEMRKYFTSVKHFKPEASRPESTELYVIARGFKKP